MPGKRVQTEVWRGLKVWGHTDLEPSHSVGPGPRSLRLPGVFFREICATGVVGVMLTLQTELQYRLSTLEPDTWASAELSPH